MQNPIKHSTQIRGGSRSGGGSKPKIISTNSQGDKFNCLATLVKNKSASVFMVQETQARKKGKHVLEDFVIFEAKRSKVGGGSMMGIHKSMNPMLISCYESDFELIIVETKKGKTKIRHY